MSDAVDTAVTIRDATEDDIDFVAWVQLTASRSHVPVGVWEYLNGTDEEQTLVFLRAIATSDTVHWCHLSLFQIAEVEGVPAAALCGFDPPTQGMEQLMTVVPPVLIELGLADLAGLMTRAEIVQRVASDFEPGAWVIENVATVPAFRRRGVMDGLLRAVLDRGRDKGFGLAQITVFIGNEPARAAYVKAGFDKVAEKRDAEFEAAMGFPGFERLLRPL